MRIIIDVQPGATPLVVQTESESLAAGSSQAIDGGSPPDYLLEALGEPAPELIPVFSMEESPVPAQAQDAGRVPDWLVEAVEDEPQEENRK
jgi:hypothetical protein